MSVHLGTHVVGQLPDRVRKLFPNTNKSAERIWQETIYECKRLGITSEEDINRIFHERLAQNLTTL